MNTYSRKIIRFFLWIVGLIIYPVIVLVNLCKKKYVVPPITNPLLLISATKLSQKIRNKKIKCEDVIKAYVERCKTVNPIINAVVEPRYEVALAEARNLDMLIASNKHSAQELEQLYPLLGIPITVKESIAVAGMSNEAGRFRSTRTPAENDAECVSQVRLAGGIPLLVSNTPELCMCWDTYNYVTGTTKNPHDTRKTSGGSSGGEAALLSSGASLIGIGSDIAGSLRLPAFYTGIFGHKPSPYSVSTVGHMPNSDSKDWNKVFILGPMTRYAEDLPLILKVLNNPKGLKLDMEKKTDIRNIKLYYMDGDGSGATGRVGSDVQEAFDNLKMYFKKKYNIVVVKAEIKNMRYCFDTSLLKLLSIDGVETIFSKSDDPSKWNSVSIEMLKKIFGCSKSIITSILYGYLKKFSKCISQETFEKADKINSNIQKEFKDLLKDNSVCFYPTFVKTAPYHYEYMRHLLDFGYLFIFNSLGLPVTNCPIGLSKNGMPIGIQVFANPGCDNLLFSVAKELEEAFGGWIPPCNAKR